MVPQPQNRGTVLTVPLFYGYATVSSRLSLLRGLCPQSARASPQQSIQSAPDFIQIGSLLAEL